ncbi:MAG: hypothetical protein M3321_08495 [Actinomycetota bacterium]|nr:hypothetical protein [Actinomycetota bacterium]
MAREQPTEPTLASLRLLDVVADRLRPDGWNVSQGYCGIYFNVELRHKLTSNFGFGFPNDDRDHSDFVEGVLSRREFKVVANRPRAVVHESLLQRVRVSAQAHQWSHEIVAVIARLLRNERLLTDEEAEWLELAGPAWVEEPLDS